MASDRANKHAAAGGEGAARGRGDRRLVGVTAGIPLPIARGSDGFSGRKSAQGRLVAPWRRDSARRGMLKNHVKFAAFGLARDVQLIPSTAGHVIGGTRDQPRALNARRCTGDMP